MSAQRADLLRRAEPIFHDAWELPEFRQAAFLEKACRNDPSLRRTVEELLAASRVSRLDSSWTGAALRNEAEQQAAALDRPTLDRYRLLETIGCGGMGVVYKAVRADDEYAKVVAIKIVHGVDSLLAGRLRQEREILARLEHPHIARLLDGGTTPDGSPFLVMEYVKGVPLDRYAGELRLPLPQLLALFQKICSAVAYAHRRLIVHRDLKPGNILVTADGEPKLLDFGIAKLMDGSAERTQTGFSAMTLAYASPEQVRGEPASTACDIYSLGVLLYELLAGVRPHGNDTEGIALATAIANDEPLSLRAPGGRRLDKDLEMIVLMALRKEAARRYASVEQFSDDLERYHDGYPVHARADTLRYRTAKFVRRNRLLLAAGGTAVASLLIGSVMAVQGAQLAQRRFNETRGIAHAMLFEIHDQIKDLPGATNARAVVIRRAHEYLDQLAQDAQGNEDLQRELAQSYRKLAEIQGGAYHANTGETAGALQSFARAQALFAGLRASRRSHDPALDTQLAELDNSFSLFLLARGNMDGGLAVGKEGIKVAEELLQHGPEEAATRSLLAASYRAVGIALSSRAEQERSAAGVREALPYLEKSLAIHRQLWQQQPDDRQRLYALTMSASYTGYARSFLGLFTTDRLLLESAVQLSRERVQWNAALYQAVPTNASYRRDLADAQESLGWAQMNAGDARAAQQSYEAAFPALQATLTSDPGNRGARQDLAEWYGRMAEVRYQNRQHEDGLADAQRAIALYEAVLQLDGGHLATLRELVQITRHWGDRSAELNRWAAATSFYESAWAHGARWAKLEPKRSLVYSEQARTATAFTALAEQRDAHISQNEAARWRRRLLEASQTALQCEKNQ